MALRTFDPAQDLLNGCVGIGRTYNDYDPAGVPVGLPPRGHWMVSPEVLLIRQGDGRIHAPVPPRQHHSGGDTPELLSGVRDRSDRAGLGVSGSEGPPGLSARARYLHRVSADNADGQTRNPFLGQISLAPGLVWSETLC